MWTVGVGGACAYGRTPAVRGCSAAVHRAGPTWRQSPRMASCCLWSIAAKHDQRSTINSRSMLPVKTVIQHHLPGLSASDSTCWNLPCTLWRSIQKSVGCWCHTPGRPHHRLGPRLTGSQNLASPHGACSVQTRQGTERETECADGGISVLQSTNADTQQSVMHTDYEQ